MHNKRRPTQTTLNPIAKRHNGPILPSKYPQGPTCDISTLNVRPISSGKPINDHPAHAFPPNSLKTNHLPPGDCVSTDHYISSTHGCLYTSYGQVQQGYTCGTIFVDHASSFIFHRLQYSSTANKTLASKLTLKQLANKNNIIIKKYHTNNGIFASQVFRQACAALHQTISFSGVGARHQNGVAERSIKTISQWACSNLLYTTSHWSTVTIKLWPQAMDYAVLVYN
jgi:transposase InsO family protein